MILYDLAKKLKDAGYRQAGHGSIHTLASSREENMRVLVGEEPKGEKIYIPTLAELIEACGEKFGVLLVERFITQNEVWVAGEYIDRDGEIAGSNSKGSTPEEAVANLWLAIHTSEGG